MVQNTDGRGFPDATQSNLATPFILTRTSFGSTRKLGRAKQKKTQMIKRNGSIKSNDSTITYQLAYVEGQLIVVMAVLVGNDLLSTCLTQMNQVDNYSSTRLAQLYTRIL